MKTLCALFIGINKYFLESNVPALVGCLSDVQNFKAFLEANFPKEKSGIVLLETQQATYKNIFQYFEAIHLQKAKEGDVVFMKT